METTFDRKSLEAIGADIKKALADIGKKYSIKLSMKGIRYSPSHFSTTVEGYSSAKDPIRERKQKMAALAHGLPEDVIGMKIPSAKSGMCTVVRIDPKRPKYAVIAETKEGKEIGFDAAWSARYFSSLNGEKKEQTPKPETPPIAEATLTAAVRVSDREDIKKVLESKGIKVKDWWFEMNGCSANIKQGSAYVKVSAQPASAGGQERKAQFTNGKVYTVAEIMSRIKSITAP
jgi:hypothetical protein